MTLAFDIPSQNFDLHTAILETVKDYLSTDEGKQVWTYNCHNFNWADFAMHINSACCERHGFSLIGSEQYSDRIVNWDEDLAGLFFASDSEEEC